MDSSGGETGSPPAESIASDELGLRLARIAQERAAEGRYPYEGIWLPEQEIVERVKQRERKSLIRLFQLLALFVTATIGGFSVILLLVAMCY